MGKKDREQQVDGDEGRATADAQSTATAALYDTTSLPAGPNPAAESTSLSEIEFAGSDDEKPVRSMEGDEDQLADHEGPAVFERQWNMCLSLAFDGAGLDVLTDWGSVPATMASFAKEHPTAPDEAVLIHVRLADKVVVLGNEDQRRVQLAVQLYRAWLQGLWRIDDQDVAALRLANEQAAAAKAAANRKPLDMDEGPFEVAKGPFDASDLANITEQRAPQAE